MVDLDKLRYAVAVAREGSLSAAAATIPLSQSALSRSIQALEREYKLRLFDRGKNGARLTQEGAAFIAQAENLIEHADAMEDELRGVGAGRGATVNFGMGSVSAAVFLPDALPDILNHPSDARVRIRVGSNGLLRDLLQRGEIDFYIGGIPRDSDNFLTSNGLRMAPIAGFSRLELMVRTGHPLIGTELSREAVSRFPVVSAPFVRDTLQSADVESLGIQRPVIELDDYDLLTGLVLTSDAILVSSSVFASHRLANGFEVLPLSLAALRKVTYALVSRLDRDLSPIAQQMAQLLFQRIRASVDSTAGEDDANHQLRPDV